VISLERVCVCGFDNHRVVDFKRRRFSNIISASDVLLYIITITKLMLYSTLKLSQIPPKHVHVPIFHPHWQERPTFYPPTLLFAHLFQIKLMCEITFSILPKTFAKPRQTLDAADHLTGNWTLCELKDRIADFLFRR